jgi:exopolysaccharide biosynthesis polyprenyl glycosylphosphotransferase
VTSSGLPRPDAQSYSTGLSDAHYSRRSAGRILALPPYDIRVRRELAHRRFYFSVGRQILRVVGLHTLDALGIAVAATVAGFLTTASRAPQLIPALVAAVLVGLNVSGAYRAGDGRRDMKRLASGVVVVGLVIGSLVVLPPRIDVSISFLSVFALAAVLVLVIGRYVVELAVRQAYAHGIGLRRALVVGRHTDVREIIDGLRTDQNLDQRVVGYVTPSQIQDSEALGTVDQIDAILDREDPAEVIITASLSPDTLRRTADACFKRGVRVLVVPWWTHAIRGWAEPVQVGRMPGYHVHPMRLAMPALLFKRVTDLAFTCFGLVFAAPLMVIVAIAIKVDSPRGPVFFRQRRVGLGGREFMMWKFRSMTPEAEAEVLKLEHLNHYIDAPLFKVFNDPRVTTVGRFLRRFSLDELPQLFNVLAGDMSLVGPRPPLPAEVGRYEPRHFVRLSVIPGLTGPWQVGGRNLIQDFEEVVRLERTYVDSWSLSLDLAIMAKTVGVVLSGKGAC